MRILILGSEGQIGAYLTEYLNNKGYEVMDSAFKMIILNKLINSKKED